MQHNVPRPRRFGRPTPYQAPPVPFAAALRACAECLERAEATSWTLVRSAQAVEGDADARRAFASTLITANVAALVKNFAAIQAALSKEAQ